MTNENGNATLADEETALSSAAAVAAAEWAKVATQHRRDAPTLGSALLIHSDERSRKLRLLAAHGNVARLDIPDGVA